MAVGTPPWLTEPTRRRRPRRPRVPPCVRARGGVFFLFFLLVVPLPSDPAAVRLFSRSARPHARRLAGRRWSVGRRRAAGAGGMPRRLRRCHAGGRRGRVAAAGGAARGGSPPLPLPPPPPPPLAVGPSRARRGSSHVACGHPHAPVGWYVGAAWALVGAGGKEGGDGPVWRAATQLPAAQWWTRTFSTARAAVHVVPPRHHHGRGHLHRLPHSWRCIHREASLICPTVRLPARRSRSLRRPLLRRCQWRRGGRRGPCRRRLRTLEGVAPCGSGVSWSTDFGGRSSVGGGQGRTGGSFS